MSLSKGSCCRNDTKFVLQLVTWIRLWLGKGKKWGETAKIHERTKKCGFAFSPDFGAQSHAKAHSINNLEMFTGISFQSTFHNKTVNVSLFLFYWQIIDITTS